MKTPALQSTRLLALSSTVALALTCTSASLLRAAPPSPYYDIPEMEQRCDEQEKIYNALIDACTEKINDLMRHPEKYDWGTGNKTGSAEARRKLEEQRSLLQSQKLDAYFKCRDGVTKARNANHKARMDAERAESDARDQANKQKLADWKAESDARSAKVQADNDARTKKFNEDLESYRFKPRLQEQLQKDSGEALTEGYKAAARDAAEELSQPGDGPSSDYVQKPVDRTNTLVPMADGASKYIRDSIKPRVDGLLTRPNAAPATPGYRSSAPPAYVPTYRLPGYRPSAPPESSSDGTSPDTTPRTDQPSPDATENPAAPREQSKKQAEEISRLLRAASPRSNLPPPSVPSAAEIDRFFRSHLTGPTVPPKSFNDLVSPEQGSTSGSNAVKSPSFEDLLKPSSPSDFKDLLKGSKP